VRKKRNAYSVLVRKPETQRPLGTPRRSRRKNIEMDLKQIRRESMQWINVAENMEKWRAVVNTVRNLRVP
jgi:hypothetical protein